MFEEYCGKRVFVTGHTGFKGSWLCEMLLLAGAKVYGYALEPPVRASLFRQLKLAKRISSNVIGDVRYFESLSVALHAADPDFVFHLAAQPLVLEGYRSPKDTFDVNVGGTVNLLEAIRRECLSPDHRQCSVVCVTTDKVYENHNRGRAFKEGDPLGGDDPYSASKGACEIAVASYMKSFFSSRGCPVSVASARAGNVVGGGDWAKNRILPDAMRAFLNNKPLVVRNRNSTRPWQHVLEALSGYLMLGVERCGGAFNFGPSAKMEKTVGQLVDELEKLFPGCNVVDAHDSNAPKEAKTLRLDSSKSIRLLKWKRKWDFETTIAKTVEWYELVDAGRCARAVTDEQIKSYFEA